MRYNAPMVKIPSKDVNLIVSLITPLVLYGWIAFLCALFAVFYAPLIWGLWIVAISILIYTKKLQFPKPSLSLGLLLIASLCISIGVALIAEPSVFGGRDQGSISDAAFLLSKNGTILHSSPEATAFAQIYGAGQALNFPGFHYTVRGELYPQFPLPYIAFLAGFVSLFGIAGYLVANAILTFFFLFLSTNCLRLLISSRAAWWFFALLVTSFPVLWFAKFTLSENLAAALVWSAITLILLLRDHAKLHLIYLTLATAALLFFTRIEGLWLAPVLLYTLWKIPQCKKFLLQNSWYRIWMPSIIFSVIGLTTLIMSTPFYKTVIGAIIPKKITSFFTGEVTNTSSNFSFLNDFTNFLMPTYLAYGLFIPLITTAIVVIYFLHKRLRHPFIVLIGISAPLFLYFIDPQISSDHPWMLRRFVWILLPITLGATVLGASLLIKRRGNDTTRSFSTNAQVFLSAVIILNLLSTAKFILYAPNASLLEQTQLIAQKFGPNDLILLSPEVTGDGWSMIDVPLRNFFDRKAIYFFNQNDYNNLDTSTFENVFLITANNGTINYTDLTQNASIIDTFTIHANRLSKEVDVFENLPVVTPVTIQNTIYQLK